MSLNDMAITKPMKFYKWCFQMLSTEFLKRFSPLEFVQQGPIKKMSSMVEVMAWCQTGTKPLPKPLVTQYIVAHIHHQASTIANVNTCTCTYIPVDRKLFIVPIDSSYLFLSITVNFMNTEMSLYSALQMKTHTNSQIRLTGDVACHNGGRGLPYRNLSSSYQNHSVCFHTFQLKLGIHRL